MLSENVLEKVRENMDDIVNMNHECSHYDFVAGIANTTSASEIYEHILYEVGCRMYNFFESDYECGMSQMSPVPGRLRGFLAMGYVISPDNERVSEMFKQAPSAFITHCFELQSEMRYIRSSLMTMPCDLPIAKALKKLFIDREEMSAEHVANLPVVLSFPLFLVNNMEPNDDSAFFFSQEYVNGLVKATENYEYPDIQRLYKISSKIIGHAISGLYCFRMEVDGYAERRDIVLQAAYDRYGVASIVDEPHINYITENSYYNTEERHRILNELFKNTVDSVKRSPEKDVIMAMKNDIENHAFCTIDAEVDKKVINYLKLLG